MNKRISYKRFLALFMALILMGSVINISQDVFADVERTVTTSVEDDVSIGDSNKPGAVIINKTVDDKTLDDNVSFDVSLDFDSNDFDYTRPASGQKNAYDVVLIVDSSGSIGSDGLKELKSYTNGLIDFYLTGEGTEENKVGIVTFGTDVKTLSSFSNNADNLKANINSLDYWDDFYDQGTNTQVGIFEAQELMNTRVDRGSEYNSIPVYVLITDGLPTYYASNGKILELGDTVSGNRGSGDSTSNETVYYALHQAIAAKIEYENTVFNAVTIGDLGSEGEMLFNQADLTDELKGYISDYYTDAKVIYPTEYSGFVRYLIVPDIGKYPELFTEVAGTTVSTEYTFGDYWEHVGKGRASVKKSDDYIDEDIKDEYNGKNKAIATYSNVAIAKERNQGYDELGGTFNYLNALYESDDFGDLDPGEYEEAEDVTAPAINGDFTFTDYINDKFTLQATNPFTVTYNNEPTTINSSGDIYATTDNGNVKIGNITYEDNNVKGSIVGEYLKNINIKYNLTVADNDVLPVGDTYTSFIIDELSDTEGLQYSFTPNVVDVVTDGSGEGTETNPYYGTGEEQAYMLKDTGVVNVVSDTIYDIKITKEITNNTPFSIGDETFEFGFYEDKNLNTPLVDDGGNDLTTEVTVPSGNTTNYKLNLEDLIENNSDIKAGDEIYLAEIYDTTDEDWDYDESVYAIELGSIYTYDFTFKNEYVNSLPLNITFTKSVDENMAPDSYPEFKFILEYVNSNNGYSHEETTISDFANDQTGTFSLDSQWLYKNATPVSDKDGIKTYNMTLKEVDGNVTDWDYAENTYNLTITLNTKTEELNCAVEGNGPLTFTNEYEAPYELTIDYYKYNDSSSPTLIATENDTKYESDSINLSSYLDSTYGEFYKLNYFGTNVHSKDDIPDSVDMPGANSTINIYYLGDAFTQAVGVTKTLEYEADSPLPDKYSFDIKLVDSNGNGYAEAKFTQDDFNGSKTSMKDFDITNDNIDSDVLLKLSETNLPKDFTLKGMSSYDDVAKLVKLDNDDVRLIPITDEALTVTNTYTYPTPEEVSYDMDIKTGFLIEDVEAFANTINADGTTSPGAIELNKDIDYSFEYSLLDPNGTVVATATATTKHSEILDLLTATSGSEKVYLDNTVNIQFYIKDSEYNYSNLSSDGKITFTLKTTGKNYGSFELSESTYDVTIDRYGRLAYADDVEFVHNMGALKSINIQVNKEINGLDFNLLGNDDVLKFDYQIILPDGFSDYGKGNTLEANNNTDEFTIEFDKDSNTTGNKVVTVYYDANLDIGKIVEIEETVSFNEDGIDPVGIWEHSDSSKELELSSEATGDTFDYTSTFYQSPKLTIIMDSNYGDKSVDFNVDVNGKTYSIANKSLVDIQLPKKYAQGDYSIDNIKITDAEKEDWTIDSNIAKVSINDGNVTYQFVDSEIKESNVIPFYNVYSNYSILVDKSVEGDTLYTQTDENGSYYEAYTANDSKDGAVTTYTTTINNIGEFSLTSLKIEDSSFDYIDLSNEDADLAVDLSNSSITDYELNGNTMTFDGEFDSDDVITITFGATLNTNFDNEDVYVDGVVFEDTAIVTGNVMEDDSEPVLTRDIKTVNSESTTKVVLQNPDYLIDSTYGTIGGANFYYVGKPVDYIYTAILNNEKNDEMDLVSFIDNISFNSDAFKGATDFYYYIGESGADVSDDDWILLTHNGTDTINLPADEVIRYNQKVSLKFVVFPQNLDDTDTSITMNATTPKDEEIVDSQDTTIKLMELEAVINVIKTANKTEYTNGETGTVTIKITNNSTTGIDFSKIDVLDDMFIDSTNLEVIYNDQLLNDELSFTEDNLLTISSGDEEKQLQSGEMLTITFDKVFVNESDEDIDLPGNVTVNAVDESVDNTDVTGTDEYPVTVLTDNEEPVEPEESEDNGNKGEVIEPTEPAEPTEPINPEATEELIDVVDTEVPQGNVVPSTDGENLIIIDEDGTPLGYVEATETTNEATDDVVTIDDMVPMGTPVEQETNNPKTSDTGYREIILLIGLMGLATGLSYVFFSKKKKYKSDEK